MQVEILSILSVTVKKQIYPINSESKGMSICITERLANKTNRRRSGRVSDVLHEIKVAVFLPW